MKNFSVAILIISLASMLSATETKKILCYGDSITAEPEGWVAMINHSDSIEAFNAGRNGRRAVNASSELAPYLEEYKDQPLDRILLSLGVNDLPARDPRPGDEKVALCAQGMREAIELALKRFEPSQITLVAPCGVNPDTMDEVNLTKGYQVTPPLLEKLEVSYRKLAEEKGIQFFSLLHAVSKENYRDGLHPNEAGHKEIAKVVQSYLSGQ